MENLKLGNERYGLKNAADDSATYLGPCERCGAVTNHNRRTGLCLACGKETDENHVVENDLRNMACPVCDDNISGVSLMIDHLEDEHDMSEAQAEKVLGARDNETDEERKKKKCPKCGGLGILYVGTMRSDCDECHGTGEVEDEAAAPAVTNSTGGIDPSGAGYEQPVETTTCTKCGHTIGQEFYEVCNCSCHGGRKNAVPLVNNRIDEGTRRYGKK